MNHAVCLFLLSSLLAGAQCRPDGAPNTACDSVSPNRQSHGAARQPGRSPYMLAGLPANGNYTPEMMYTRECALPLLTNLTSRNDRTTVCIRENCKVNGLFWEDASDSPAPAFRNTTEGTSVSKYISWHSLLPLKRIRREWSLETIDGLDSNLLQNSAVVLNKFNSITSKISITVVCGS